MAVAKTSDVPLSKMDDSPTTATYSYSVIFSFLIFQNLSRFAASVKIAVVVIIVRLVFSGFGARMVFADFNKGLLALAMGFILFVFVVFIKD